MARTSVCRVPTHRDAAGRVPNIGNCRGICGADPLVRAGPLDPLFADEISFIHTVQADGGVGCGPGGPPHIQCGLCGCWEKYVALGRVPAPRGHGSPPAPAPSRFTKPVKVSRVRAQIPASPLDRANQPGLQCEVVCGFSSLRPRKLSLQSFPNQAGFALPGAEGSAFLHNVCKIFYRSCPAPAKRRAFLAGI